jgi:F420-dependent methylenetetrahydromethanopterin dehydrogenase
VALAAVVALLAACGHFALAQDRLTLGTVSADGGESSGNRAVLHGSFGQPFAGYSQGPSVVWGGFIPAAVPPPPGTARQIHLEADPPSIVVNGSTSLTLRAEIRDLRNNVAPLPPTC